MTAVAMHGARLVRTSLAAAFHGLRQGWERRRAIRRLEEMDDAMLKDIGLHRSEIRRAVVYGSSGRIDGTHPAP